MTAEELAETQRRHYSDAFFRHGATPQGVDWGANAEQHRLRLDRMLALTKSYPLSDVPTLLDVGCGFGSLLDFAIERNRPLAYHGVDLCEPMIEFARRRHPTARWDTGDAMGLPLQPEYDFVVCNGILTQKLSATIREMDAFAQGLVRRMFELCRIGCAFNVMTTYVNFMVDNLYYRNPAELLGWCMAELTPKARLDHSYPLFEYTIYLFRENALPGPAAVAPPRGLL